MVRCAQPQCVSIRTTIYTHTHTNIYTCIHVSITCIYRGLNAQSLQAMGMDEFKKNCLLAIKSLQRENTSLKVCLHVIVYVCVYIYTYARACVCVCIMYIFACTCGHGWWDAWFDDIAVVGCKKMYARVVRICTRWPCSYVLRGYTKCTHTLVFAYLHTHVQGNMHTYTQTNTHARTVCNAGW